VVDESNKPFNAPERSVERDFVQILDHDVVVVAAEVLLEIAPGEKCVGVSIPYPMDIESVEVHAWLRVVPGAAEKIHGVTMRDDSREDFPQMKLGSARVRILVILPVEDEYPH
jgi:hypothetical protein